MQEGDTNILVLKISRLLAYSQTKPDLITIYTRRLTLILKRKIKGKNAVKAIISYVIFF